MTRHYLGAWRCPSGNACDVFIRRAVNHSVFIEFEWDQASPLDWRDELDYVARIRPEVLARAREHFAKSGLTLLVVE